MRFIERLLQEGRIKRKKETPSMREGTIAHTHLNKANLLRNPYAYDSYPDREMRKACLMALDYVEELEPDRVYSEIFVDPVRFVKTRHCSGTADIICIVDDTLYVIDFKYGVWHVVSAIDNTQLLLYALGAFAKYGARIKRVVMAIIQPRAYHPDGPIREWAVDIDLLMDWAVYLKQKAKKALSQHGEFNPSENACVFCDAKPECRAHAEWELTKVRDVFTAVEEDEKLKNIDALTAREIEYLLNHAHVFQNWLSELFAYAYALESDKPHTFEKWHITDKRGQRAYIVPEDELSIYFSEAELYERKLRSPAQLEKIAGAVSPFCEMRSSGTTLAPVTRDSRKTKDSFGD